MNELLMRSDRWLTRSTAMKPQIAVIVLMVASGFVWLVVQFGSSRGAADVPNVETPVTATESSSPVEELTESITPAATLSVEERVLQSAIEQLELSQAIRSEADPAKRNALESRSRAIQAKRLQLYNYEQE